MPEQHSALKPQTLNANLKNLARLRVKALGFRL